MSQSVATTSNVRTLPLPTFFDDTRVNAGKIRRVDYALLAKAANDFKKLHGVKSAAGDKRIVSMWVIDGQGTFTQPDAELFVSGRSGDGAVQDSLRLAEFIYKHLELITDITFTLDTHKVVQIFHPAFWQDTDGNPPPAHTTISEDDIRSGKWRPSMAACHVCNHASPAALTNYCLHYVRELKKSLSLDLYIWPYHAEVLGVGHAVDPALEEAAFFHAIARSTDFEIKVKGGNPLTENYSVISPEVTTLPDGTSNGAQLNAEFLTMLQTSNAVIIAGQAKSHCVLSTIKHLLALIQANDPALADKVYLLGDCASAVYVPNVVDFTDMAEAAYRDFADAGMHLVNSTDDVKTWKVFQ